MSHSLVLGLFPSVSQAAAATRALHDDGFSRESLSVVARSHAEEVAMARELDATAGVEIEDSRPAGRLGELGAVVIAAAAVAMPGVAPLVAAGPLAAELGEAAGHLAGGLADVSLTVPASTTHAPMPGSARSGRGACSWAFTSTMPGRREWSSVFANRAPKRSELARWEGALP